MPVSESFGLSTNGTLSEATSNAPQLGVCRLPLRWSVSEHCGRCAEILTWDEAKQELEAPIPRSRAGQIGIQESRAYGLTAFLGPTPDLTIASDQVHPVVESPFRPLSDSVAFLSSSYLVERRGKRGLRRESAQKATAIAVSQQEDLKRSLLFDLRNAFVQVLQQKAVVGVTRESLDYYDRLLAVSRDRYKAGDIAQVDLDRQELQRTV